MYHVILLDFLGWKKYYLFDRWEDAASWSAYLVTRQIEHPSFGYSIVRVERAS